MAQKTVQPERSSAQRASPFLSSSSAKSSIATMIFLAMLFETSYSGCGDFVYESSREVRENEVVDVE